MPRDYVREMDELFNKLINDRDSLILRDLANEALTWCEMNDPELLRGWLAVQAEDMMWQALSRKQAGERAKATRTNTHAVFELALRSAGPGGNGQKAQEYLSMLDARFACNKKNERKKYGHMTKEEVLYVASTYERLENRSRLRRLFHQTVANQLEDGQTVANVFTPQKLMGIQRELGIDD